MTSKHESPDGPPAADPKISETSDQEFYEEHPGIPEEPTPFQHPQWMLGVVLILAFVTLYAGFFGNPVWFLIGSPFVVTLAIFLWARFIHPRLQ